MTMVATRPAPVRSGAARQFDSVYRVVTIVASHPTSWAGAAVDGIAELAKTITDLRVAEVVERDTVVRRGRVTAYRVKLRVSFRIDARRVVGDRTVAVRRCLVIANQTVSSPALAALLDERIAAGPCEVHLLVPLRVPALAGSTLMVRPWTDRTVRDGQAADAAREKARRLAEARLSPLLDHLGERGVPATWETSFDDPTSAAAAVVDRAAFDEVVVSTLPAALSRWLRVDLPRRLQRRCGLPVTVVEDRSGLGGARPAVAVRARL
jgi:flavin-binding protein dodecin